VNPVAAIWRPEPNLEPAALAAFGIDRAASSNCVRSLQGVLLRFGLLALRLEGAEEHNQVLLFLFGILAELNLFFFWSSIGYTLNGRDKPPATKTMRRIF
jgi:hypothetical protein